MYEPLDSVCDVRECKFWHLFLKVTFLLGRGWNEKKARPFSTLKSKERVELLDDLIESGFIVKQIEENSYYYKLAS
ncbi:hypothetical protein [Sulfurimonas denitrificans]|uniref:hypothetical protein n=1 Tax=Sulfurimonas denitrificans TaxID=39766 RepID=UPI0005A0C547|nr:hypothetical protein [Sulfurimonas denitrificans]